MNPDRFLRVSPSAPRIPGAIVSGLALLLLAPSLAFADSFWSGRGDGTSWSDAANWSGDVVPGPADDVVLDHSLVPSGYTVTLPGGTVTVEIHRLQVAPDGGETIAVLLPSTNTANPGLRVGDGIPDTDDLVIDAGGVVKNASAANAGNGIEVASLLDGTVRINDGGRYVHASVRSTSGITPRLSTAAGTGAGEFEYDVPGTADFNIAASGRTYGSLTLTRTAGAATYGALGASALTVRGTLRTNPGVRFAPTLTGEIVLEGDFESFGAPAAFPASQPVRFGGAGARRITGVDPITLRGPVTIPPGVTLAIALRVNFNNRISIAGELRLDPGGVAGGVGPYSYDSASGTLTFNPDVVSNVIDGRYWPSTESPARIQVTGAGIRMPAPRAVPGAFHAYAPVLDAQFLTLQALAVLETQESRFTGSPTYGSAATLRYASGGAYERGDEWSADAGAGHPRNVSIGAGTTLDLGAGGPGTSRSLAGDLSIEPGALLTMNAGANAMSAPLAVGGALEVDGSLELSTLAGAELVVGGNLAVTGTLETHQRAVVLNGTGAQDLSGGPLVLPELRLEKPGGIVTLSSDLTVETALDLGDARVLTGVNVLSVGPAGVVTRGAGRVDGNLRKPIGTGTSSATFEVGSAALYAPVDLAYDEVTTEGTVIVSTAPGDHVAIAGSGLFPARTANRVWNVTHDGVIGGSVQATFHFDAADLDAGANPLAFEVRRFDAGAWTPETAGARTSTSTTATGVTGYGAFAIGEVGTSTPDTVEARVAAGNDDAEEGPTGSMYLNSSDLEMMTDGSSGAQRRVGMRFTNLAIPADATVTAAWIQFHAKEAQSEATSLTVWANAADDAAPFSGANGSLSALPTTTGASWPNLTAWTAGEAGPAQRTPDLAGAIQEIVSRPGWQSGNALAILVTGAGHRTASAFESGAGTAPLLHVEFTSGPPSNQAPVVNAGPDTTVILPGEAFLRGTVADDGLPAPAALSIQWTAVVAPFAVAFDDPQSPVTRATFGGTGVYRLELMAGDGERTSRDTMNVTVSDLPVPVTLEMLVATGGDDGEEGQNGSVSLTGNDLEMMDDGNFTQRRVAMRFTNLTIPADATVTAAWIQFRANEAQSEATSLSIAAQLADNAPPFASSHGALSDLPATAGVSWPNVPAWATGTTGPAQRTTDIAGVIQQIVGRPGWQSGNSIAILVTGTGHRTASAFESGASFAPLLHVEYTSPAGASSAGPAVRSGTSDVRSDFAARLYPNPPGANATLSLVTTREGFVRVRIFDTLGRRIRTLLDAAALPAGRHLLPIGTSRGRARLDAGVYFYSVEAAEGSLHGKFTILE